MKPGFLHFMLILALSVCLPNWGQIPASPTTSQSSGESSNNGKTDDKLQPGAILIKGAWSSASDSVTPVPESGSIAGNVYTNQYFGISYPLHEDWIQRAAGPPPSDSGSYVLTLLSPPATYTGPAKGNLLIAAQDMFFTPLPVTSASELIAYKQSHLEDVYALEQQPSEIKIAGRSFSSFAYWSPGTGLHWYVLATDIRCHAVQFTFMNRDPKMLQRMVQEMNKMKLPPEAGPAGDTGDDAFPVCINGYAKSENVIAQTHPIFTEHRPNSIPVRIVIDKEGKIKHIHFLSAFPDQVEAITQALGQWKFRPYLRDGKPLEVETGIMFGRAPYGLAPVK